MEGSVSDRRHQPVIPALNTAGQTLPAVAAAFSFLLCASDLYLRFTTNVWTS